MSWGLLSNTVTRAETGRADPQPFRLVVASEESTPLSASPRQAEKTPFPPPAVVPVRKAGRAAEGDPNAV